MVEKAEKVEKVEKVKEVVKSGCPWCAKNGVKDTAVLTLVDGRTQCGTCGKHWDGDALGKPWTLELERGERWARENRARQLSGG